MRNIILVGVLLLAPLAQAKSKHAHCFIVTPAKGDPNTYNNQIGELEITKNGIENMKFAAVALDGNSMIELSHDEISQRADANNFKDLDGRVLVAVQGFERDHVGISVSKIDASKAYKDMPEGSFAQGYIGNRWQRNLDLWSFEHRVDVTCMWK